jgi:SAM-dependent methyltransferase
MTTTDHPTDSIDEDAMGAFADELFGAALGALETTTTYLGRHLGLYTALRGTPSTAGDLARTAGIDARYAQEWLEQQAAAGTLTVDDPGASAEARTYTLREEHAIVLLDDEHPAFSGALADFMGPIAHTLDLVSDAFRTGAGVPFAAYGLHDMQAAFTRPMFATSLVPEWLPALADVHARLEAGEALRVADFGCGEGWAAIYIAEGYPNVTVDGFDLDDTSIAEGRKHAAERGVSDRVHLEVQDVTDPAFAGQYDLVLATEVIHDLADPVSALAAMRRMTAGGGAVLIIDENADDSFAAPADPVQRFLYVASVLHCLPAGRVGDSSVATGTVMRPTTFEGYAHAAGFASVDQLPIENPFFRFYRLNG